MKPKKKPRNKPRREAPQEIATRIEATDEEYRALRLAAVTLGISTQCLLGEIVRGWLKSRGRQ